MKVHRGGRRDDRDRGGVTVFFAVMASAVVAAAGLAVDGGRRLAAVSTATDIADNAARACAQAVDEAAAASGQLTLDPIKGEALGQSMIAASGVAGTVTVNATSCTVTVSATAPTVFLGSSVSVSSTQQAEILVGNGTPLP